MRAFTLARPTAGNPGGAVPEAMYIAGGTDLMQLMKNDVARPAQLVDLTDVLPDHIAASATELRLDARATMADVAAHPEVVRNWPMLSQAILLSASQQVRNMATMGGNLLQRTRCNYFRDPGFAACNKRNPGSGCAALRSDRRDFAVLGTSAQCIALHASDMAVAMTALDAVLELRATDGTSRRLPLANFYRLPGDTPQLENALAPGELIAAIVVPADAAARKSGYLKVRDRSSFAFALCSAAVGLDIQGGTIRGVRVAMGGVGTVPWRLPEAEAALRGQRPGDDLFRQVAQRLQPPAGTAEPHFKFELARRVLVRSLQTIAA